VTKGTERGTGRRRQEEGDSIKGQEGGNKMKETKRKVTGGRVKEVGDRNDRNNKEGPLRRGQEGGNRINGTGMKETIRNSQEGED
jgi:hypothetical protein